MSTIQNFIDQNKITLTSEYADQNPNMEDDWQANHYRVTLHRGRKQYTTYFSKGLALDDPPSADEVLDCLASDAEGFDNARSFEDWAKDYGYNEDSRKAEKVYKACAREAANLKRFLGELYDTLLYNTERL